MAQSCLASWQQFLYISLDVDVRRNKTASRYPSCALANPILSLNLYVFLCYFSTCSHFWVVVVRLDDRGTPHSDITQAAIIPVSPPTDPPETNAPYVVAEMSAETYQENRELFVIGDEEKTQELNDFPELYRNLPLLPGSTYTAFVRGFAHFIPPSRVS